MGSDVQFWDRVAKKYAAGLIADMPGYERTLARVSGLLQPSDRVVELGCGTGTTALRLAGGVSDYLATDFSSEMIGIGRGKLATAAVPSLRFEVETSASLASQSSQAATWDVALGFNVLHLVPDLHRAVAEVRRLVRPGGLFISKTPCLREMNPLIPLLVPVARFFGRAPSVLVFSAAELEAAIAAAGFSIEGVERHGSGRKDPRAFIIARAV